METTYNGWTNRATWCVALWLDNDGEFNYWREYLSSQLESDKRTAVARLQHLLQAGIEDRTHETLNPSGMLSDLLMGCLASVNWREIALNCLNLTESDLVKEDVAKGRK